MPLLRAGVIALAVAVGVGGVALHLHGFSLPYWHQWIDGSPAPEVLAGEPRWIRGDDWYVLLPIALGQALQDPPFPRVNPDIGLGQDLIVPLSVPIAHPVTLLRPELWGFFVGPDTGLAWLWWSRIVGLFVVLFALLDRLAGGRPGLAALGAGALVAAPYFRLWTYNGAPPVIWAGTGVLAFAAILRADRPARIAGWAALLAYALAAFAVALYPPHQIPLAYLALALGIGWLASEWRALRARPYRGLRLAALGVAGVVAVAAVAALAWGAADAIRTMAGTAYPGRRLELGGGSRPFWELMNANLGLTARTLDADAAKSFWLLSPGVVLALGWRTLRRGDRIDPITLALLAFVLLLLVYCSVGLPEPLVRATGLALVPPGRATLALGIADALLAVRFLAGASSVAAVRTGPGAAIGLAVAGIAALSAVRSADAYADASVAGLAPWVALNGALGFVVATRRVPHAVLAVALVGAAAAAPGFNPWVRGGAGYLADNPLSRRILELDREAGGRSLWAVYGDFVTPNLLRAIGVHALNGVQPLPQLDLWARFDPTGSQRRVYDRYAHVELGLPVPGARRRPYDFELEGQGAFRLRVAPDAEPMRALGVTHVLAHTRYPERFDRLPALEPVGRVGENYLYRLRPRPDP